MARRSYRRQSDADPEGVKESTAAGLPDDPEWAEPTEPYEAEAGEVEEEPSGTTLLAPEPRDDSIVGRIKHAIGFGNRMELKPWAGLDRYVCNKCGWEEFGKAKAKQHRC